MGGGKQSTDNTNSSVYNPPTYLFHLLYVGGLYI